MRLSAFLRRTLDPSHDNLAIMDNIVSVMLEIENKSVTISKDKFLSNMVLCNPNSEEAQELENIIHERLQKIKQKGCVDDDIYGLQGFLDEAKRPQQAKRTTGDGSESEPENKKRRTTGDERMLFEKEEDAEIISSDQGGNDDDAVDLESEISVEPEDDGLVVLEDDRVELEETFTKCDTELRALPSTCVFIEFIPEDVDRLCSKNKKELLNKLKELVDTHEIKDYTPALEDPPLVAFQPMDQTSFEQMLNCMTDEKLHEALDKLLKSLRSKKFIFTDLIAHVHEFVFVRKNPETSIINVKERHNYFFAALLLVLSLHTDRVRLPFDDSVVPTKVHNVLGLGSAVCDEDGKEVEKQIEFMMNFKPGSLGFKFTTLDSLCNSVLQLAGGDEIIMELNVMTHLTLMMLLKLFYRFQ